MIIDTEHLADRILYEALAEATRMWWVKRAEQLESAQHRPGIDWPGRATDDELAERNRGLTEAARACWARSAVAPAEDLRELVAAVLQEVA